MTTALPNTPIEIRKHERTTIRQYLSSVIAIHGRETCIPNYLFSAGDLEDLYAKLDELEAALGDANDEKEKLLAALGDRNDALASDIGDAKRENKYGKGL